MFSMSDLSIALSSTEKHTYFLESVAPNLLDMLPKQNWVRKLTLLLSASNLLISFSLTKNNYHHDFNVNSSNIFSFTYWN